MMTEYVRGSSIWPCLLTHEIDHDVTKRVGSREAEHVISGEHSQGMFLAFNP